MTSLSSELKYLKRSLKTRRELLSVCSTMDVYGYEFTNCLGTGKINLGLICDKNPSKYKLKS